MVERRTIHFSGRVQGVGFRMTAVHLASGLALAGTVENLADGRVQLVAEGEAATIDTFIQRLREHFGGSLRMIEQHSSAAGGKFDAGIHILH